MKAYKKSTSDVKMINEKSYIGRALNLIKPTNVMHKSHIEFANGYVSALTLYLIGSFRMVCVSKNVHAGSSLSNKISYRKPTFVT